MTDETMPLMLKRYGSGRKDLEGPDEMPMEWLRPHAAQAWSNHGQTLDLLKIRHGLSPLEALAIYEDMDWREASDKWTEAEALDIIAEMIRASTEAQD